MDNRQPVNLLAFSLLMITSVIAGFQQVGLKATAEYASPMLQIGLRSVGAALVIAMLIYLRGDRISFRGPVARAGIVAGLLFAFEYVFLAEGLRYTTASHAVVFLYSAPIFAAVGLHFFIPSERLSGIQWLGMAVASLGLAIAFLSNEHSLNYDLRAVLFGDLLALLAGICWGATTIAIRLTVLQSTPAMQTLFYQLLAAAVVLLPLSYFTGQFSFQSEPILWANVAFQTFVVCALSFSIWLWLLNRFVATQLGVFSFLTPLFGVVFGILTLHEPLTSAFVVGGIGVLFGILLVNLRPWLLGRDTASRLA